MPPSSAPAPGTEETYTKQMDHDEGPITVEIIDTAGQDDYHSFREASMGYGQAFLLVYSIADRTTFDKVRPPSPCHNAQPCPSRAA
jgi:GTPase SAR1 family protein